MRVLISLSGGASRRSAPAARLTCHRELKRAAGADKKSGRPTPRSRQVPGIARLNAVAMYVDAGADGLSSNSVSGELVER